EAVYVPTPLYAQPEHFAHIGTEVIVDFMLCPLDPDAFHVCGHNIKTLIREVEVISGPRHDRTELSDQRVDIVSQSMFERRIVSPMADRALASMLGVFVDLRGPAHEPMKVVGRIDVALSAEAWSLLAEHQQIALARKLVHERLQQC